MRSQIESSNKKYFVLAALSAVMTIFFSLMSAPFLRVLAMSKSWLFWLVGFGFVSALFYFQAHQVAVYVGAIWMTLGLYSELERRGVSWKKSGLISVTAGVVLGALTFIAAIKGSLDHALVKQVVEPLMTTLNQVLPDEKFEAQAMLWFMPGILASALVSTLAFALVFESQVFQVFQIKREKMAYGLKWIEFRLPDLFIWVSLFSFLFALIETKWPMIQTIALNLTILSFVTYFFQGLAVIEFATRIYRFGRFSKFALYIFIFLWALPLVALAGLADYWIDFRRHMRKKLKAH